MFCRTWLWGELHTDFMDALMPMVSQPVEIAGRDRIFRKTAVDLIRNYLEELLQAPGQ